VTDPLQHQQHEELPFSDLPSAEELELEAVWFDALTWFDLPRCQVCGDELVETSWGDYCPTCEPDLLAMGLQPWEIEPYGMATLPADVLAAIQQWCNPERGRACGCGSAHQTSGGQTT